MYQKCKNKQKGKQCQIRHFRFTKFSFTKTDVLTIILLAHLTGRFQHKTYFQIKIEH